MENSDWVLQELASLNPPEDWQLNPSPALARLHARERRDFRWAIGTLAAAVTIAVVLLPSARAVAQQVWQFLTVKRVAFIRVNPWPDGVPSPQVNLIGTPLPIPAASLEQAQQRVHYQPRLPRPGVLSGSPQLYTTLSVAGGTVVKVIDLQLALTRAGVTDQTVPPAWDGAQLALHTSPVVLALWPNDLALAQSLPLTLTAPANFDFAAYSALILRVLGVAPEEAALLAQQMGTAPPWQAPISKDLDAQATFEEVTLNSGPATLLEQPGQRVTLTWNVPDRVYILTGTASRDLVIAAANAVQ